MMSNVFDDLITSAKNLVDIAGKKTDNVVEVSKLKYQCVQMTSDLRSLYEKLGNAVYTMVKADFDNKELMDSLIEEIDSLKEKIDETNLHMKGTRVNIESLIRMTCLIAAPLSLGIFSMANPILTLLYPGKAAEVAIAAPVLSLQGISLVFLGLTSPLFAALQALGRADLPPKFMLLGAALKFIVNYVTIGIPAINVQGAAAGTAVCYAVILILSLVWLVKITGIRFHFVRLLWKPLAAGALCAGTAYGCYRFLSGAIESNSLKTLIAIAAAGVVYLAAALLLRGLTADDILMLPKGEKFAKLLAKYRRQARFLPETFPRLIACHFEKKSCGIGASGCRRSFFIRRG